MPAAKVVYAVTCPTCGRTVGNPFRVHDLKGAVLSGCVDHFHGGHLVSPSASARWHNRPEAKVIRREQKAIRNGFVTEYRNPNTQE